MVVSKPLIMIVDDNPANVLIGTFLLEELGYDYIVAVSGLEAITLYKTTDISLILMDLQMPHMSGFEAAASIRGYEQNGMLDRIPIIAVSAKVWVNRRLCSESGVDDFLAKPYTPEQLNRIIRLHLSSKTTVS